MTKLNEDEVRDGLGGLAGWDRDGDEIVKEYRFDGFGDAVAFVVAVAFRAEKANHHPDLDIRYNRVRVSLSTHSEGGITAKDMALAGEIEAVAGPGEQTLAMFTELLHIALVAVAAPLLVALAPRLRVPAVVLEIVGGIVI